MNSAKSSNRNRNRIIVIAAAVVLVIIALLLFVNANNERVVEQNNEYLETATDQTSRRINDLFTSSINYVETAASAYAESLTSAEVDPWRIAKSLNFPQFDYSFIFMPDGTAYRSDGQTDVGLDKPPYVHGMQGETGTAAVKKAIFNEDNIAVFYSPVMYEGEVVFIVVCAYRESTLTEYMDTTFGGAQTPTYLIEADGNIVARSSAYNNTAADLQEIYDRDDYQGVTPEDIDKALNTGQSVGFSFTTPSGTGITYISRLDDFDWAVVTTFPPTVTSSMIARANTAGFILVAAVLVAAIIVIILLARQARSENKELVLERQEATRIIDASTNLYTGLFVVNLVDGTYEFLKRSERARNMPAKGNSADLKKHYEGIVKSSTSAVDGTGFIGAQAIERALKPGIPYLQEEWSVEVEGGTRWYQASILCLERDGMGAPTSILVATQDVTGVKERDIASREALEEAFRAAEYASQAKSDFLSSMSHDIRTPMNSIMGLTSIASMHVEDTARVRECLANISSASKHLLGLINEVLDMAKIESGSIDLTEEPFDLPESVENLVTIMNPQIAAKKQNLKIELVDIKHENVIGDPTRLQQVFVNIMGNSIKFTPEGGTIGLRITELESRIPESGCYEFVFTDTGCGMSEEFLKKVFDPFTRANDSRTTKVEGTGLGMAIVKSVVSLMSGSIEVESEEGKGTTFTVIVHLKLRDGAEENLEALKDIHVLVVDDDEIACEGACNLLQDIGMRSAYELSGKKGIEAVERALDDDPFKVIILDWRMPEMSGLEAAKRIREITAENVPIIILSAYDWSIIEQEAREVGINAFISKPLFRSRLVQVMQEMMNGETAGVVDAQALLEGLNYSDRRVLLTEDNAMAAAIAEELIGMTGAKVDHAENGQVAVEMLDAHEPDYYDIVLMDIQMPVMNGYEAAAAIREHGKNRPDLADIPIVALSADAFAEDVRHARASGMNDHMSKPLEISTLVRMLEKWMP